MHTSIFAPTDLKPYSHCGFTTPTQRSMSSHKRPVQARPDSDSSSAVARDLNAPGVEEGPGLLAKLMELPVSRLSRQQLKRLEEHQYSSAGRSLLEPFMQGFWCWLVSKVPLWMAPNLITIVGLATNIISTLILAYYCPTATEQVLCTFTASVDSFTALNRSATNLNTCSFHLLSVV